MPRMDFKGIGWISKTQVKRRTTFLSISKLIVVGNMVGLKQKMYSYFAEENKRKVIVTYLDGNP